MLAIKLQRIGKKHQPSYRVVVAEKRSKMAAPPVEDLGSYNPSTKTAMVKKERVLYWIKMGARPTITMHNLLVRNEVISVPKLAVKMKKAIIKPVREAVTMPTPVGKQAREMPIKALAPVADVSEVQIVIDESAAG